MWPFSRKRTVTVSAEQYQAQQQALAQFLGKRPNDEGYTVGYIDGKTILKIKAGTQELGVALTPDEVYRMIRLLRASLNQDDPNDPYFTEPQQPLEPQVQDSQDNEQAGNPDQGS
jgi:hypothetical protein